MKGQFCARLRSSLPHLTCLRLLTHGPAFIAVIGQLEFCASKRLLKGFKPLIPI
jgi:hypothetical protein